MVEAVLAYTLKCVDEASSAMQKVQASIGLMGSAVGELGGGFSSLGNVMTGFASAGVVGAVSAGVGEVIKGLQWSVQEAANSEQAFKNLSEAVKRSGTSWTDVEAKTRSYLTQLQATTVYSDEALAGVIERLLTFGLSYEQAMNAAGAALDLAASKHMDLESAASLVGKAVDGNTGILKRYGVDVEVAKDATDKFTPVIAALNEQFGGAAQAQAQTYAGIQERLKNATSELGEKIGGILLPGLASVTEAMIPVVDQFGKGVDAIKAWLTEVGKMPEVKAVTDAVGSAFQGLQTWFQDVGRAGAEILGPVLQELWSALKEIWDALQPLFEAFGELWGVFTEGEGSGNALKDVLGIVAIGIRAIADVIREVAPVVKAFAQAFKEAADFIRPVLAAIRDDIVTFLDALRSAFQGFYNRLVGGSLWQDIWNRMLGIVGEMAAQILGNLTTQFFQPMYGAFTGAMQTIQGIWSGGFGALSGTLTGFAQSAQGTISGIISGIQGAVGQVQSALGGIFGGGATTSGYDLAHTAEQLAAGPEWPGFSVGLTERDKELMGLASAAETTAETVQQATTVVTDSMQTIPTMTAPAMQRAVSTVVTSTQKILEAANTTRDRLTRRSIWPDMMDEMAAATEETMAQIEARVLKGFASVVATAQAGFNDLQAIRDQAVAFLGSYTGANASAAFLEATQAAQKAATSVAGHMGAFTSGGQTYDIGTVGQVLATQGYWNPAYSMNLTAQGMREWGQALAEATEIAKIQMGLIPPQRVPEMYKQYIPVTVQVDGRTVAKTVEQRLVSQYQTSTR